MGLLRYTIILVVAATTFNPAFSQQSITIKGILVDNDNDEPVIGGSVLFVNVKDSTLSKFSSTDTNGRFEVKGLTRAFHKVVIQSINYENYVQFFRIVQDADLGVIPLLPDAKTLDEVVIKGEVIAVEQKGDTTIFRADAFTTNPDASAAELVGKMPGVVVSETGIESNGERIQQVLVDGKRFFGQDPLLALNTVPAEVVNQVEVFDQQSERSQFTGFNDGNTVKTMNLITKEGKRKGQFGTIYGGIGTDERYSLEGNVNDFKKDRQLTIMGMSNNINQKAFTDSDALGVRSGARGGNAFFGGGSAQVPVGITQTHSGGINYSNQFNENWRVESSYFYDQAELENAEVNQRETFLGQGDESQIYNEETDFNSVNKNHRLDMRLEHNLNENNSFIFTPSVVFQDNEQNELTTGQTTNGEQVLNSTENEFISESDGYNISGDLLWRHNFSKRGRSLLWNLGTTLNSNNQDEVFDDFNTDTTYTYINNLSENAIRTEVTYAEPVGLNSQFQTSYYLEMNNRERDRFTTELTDENRSLDGLSGALVSDVVIHRPALNFSKRSFDKFFSLELALQHSQWDVNLNDNGALNRSTTNLLPSLFGRVTLGKNVNLFGRYSTSVGLPSTRQLLEVIDNSNPLFYSIGNSSLEQSFSHQLFTRISKSNIEKNTSVSNFIIVRATNNNVTNAIYTANQDSLLTDGIILPRGGQISVPENIDGYWNVRNNTTYSFVISPLKLNMNTGVGFSYTRNPGLTNEIENISETYNVNTRIVAASNISENVDFNLSYVVSWNDVTNSVQANQDNQFANHTFSGNLNLIFLKGFVFRTDINHQIYNGVNDAFDTEYTLWNASIAYKFLKNDLGELTFTVFDLLGQNQSVTQNVTSAFIEETRSLVLEQYFMLSFRYQIRKFRS